MRVYNVHEAKTHLSRLIRAAAAGEPFVIARRGKPVVKVVAADAREQEADGRTGFLAGRIAVPDDFDRMASDEIAAMFGADE